MASWSNSLQPWLRPYARALVARFPRLQVTSVRRTYSEQLRLWHNRHNNPYPVAPPGSSMHELGRAFDVVGPANVLAAAGRMWQSWGGTWGARRDPIHFEA